MEEVGAGAWTSTELEDSAVADGLAETTFEKPTLFECQFLSKVVCNN